MKLMFVDGFEIDCEFVFCYWFDLDGFWIDCEVEFYTLLIGLTSSYC